MHSSLLFLHIPAPENNHVAFDSQHQSSDVRVKYLLQFGKRRQATPPGVWTDRQENSHIFLRTCSYTQYVCPEPQHSDNPTDTRHHL
ncbi:hypothetical protein D3C76_1434850 [compost metagenome]